MQQDIGVQHISFLDNGFEFRGFFYTQGRGSAAPESIDGSSWQRWDWVSVGVAFAGDGLRCMPGSLGAFAAQAGRNERADARAGTEIRQD